MSKDLTIVRQVSEGIRVSKTSKHSTGCFDVRLIGVSKYLMSVASCRFINTSGQIFRSVCAS